VQALSPVHRPFEKQMARAKAVSWRKLPTPARKGLPWPMVKTSCRSRKVSRREMGAKRQTEKGGVVPLYSLDLTQIFVAREDNALDRSAVDQ
jgi:hypothetical protein